MAAGTIIWFDSKGGFGFISRPKNSQGIDLESGNGAQGQSNLPERVRLERDSLQI